MKARTLRLTVVLVVALLMTACAAPAAPAGDTAAAPSGEGEKVEIEWWHISTQEDQAAYWQMLADEYMAEHPDVQINITILENEAFKSRMTTVMQAGDPPDLFQSWGGGVLYAFADAGLLRDITPEIEGAWKEAIAAQSALALYGKDGQQFGVPWQWGAVGMYYNKDLFAQAGLDPENPPATWSDFLAAVQTLKDAGITPITVGEKEKWPGHFWWVYLAIRNGGQDAFMKAYTREGGFTDEPFVKAGQDLMTLIEMEPFPDSYMGLGYADSASLFGNGQAAMELMGQWHQTFQASNSESGEGVPNLGWFPFPMVEGGAGDASDVLGGGDGIAVGRDAPDAAVDFLRFITSPENQQRQIEVGFSPPTATGTEDLVTDPIQRAILDARNNAAYLQLYYDQFLPPSVGEAVNDGVEQLFGQTATPEEVAQQIEDAASIELD